MKSEKIINGFCFLKDEDVIFVDLVTENNEKFKKSYFNKFIQEYQIDDECIVLANKDGGYVTMLFKYKLTNSKTKMSIKAKDKSIDNLIDVCYKICIEFFQRKT